MAGFNLKTTSSNVSITNFTALAISNLSDADSITLKWSSDDGGDKYFTILPSQAWAIPIIGDRWDQIYIEQAGGSMSVFTDGVMVDV